MAEDFIHLKIKITDVGGKRPPAFRQMVRAIRSVPLAEIMVSQAKRRIDKGGDSQIKYKRLWADTFSVRRISNKSRLDSKADITSDAMEVGKAERSIASARKRMLKAVELGKVEGFDILFPVGKKDKKTSHAIRHGTAAKSLERAQKRLDRLGGSAGRSYRAGGKPLLDTRNHIYNTLHSTGTTPTSTGIKATLRGSFAALYQHHGFKTKGPNFIPLTLHARRTHKPGANPNDEGLIKGQDYIMKWDGVEVPARPIFRVAPEDKKDIIKTIKIHLKRYMKKTRTK